MAKNAPVHLRVGFFTEVYRPVVNGVVASVDGLAAGLRARGNEVYCFAPRMPGGESEGPIVRMPSLPLPNLSPYRLTVPVLSRRNLNNVIKRLSLVHVHSPFVTGWMGLRYARRYGMPIVSTYLTQLEAYAHYVPFEPKATRFAASQLTRTFANLVDAVIVPTHSMAERLRSMGVTTRIETVPSGIDVAHFSNGVRSEVLRARCGVRPGEKLLVSVSRLAREKNHAVVLHALARSADRTLRLAIAGDGPSREDMELLAAELGIADRTTFLGSVGRAELPNLYASADAFVFPSTTETQGLVQVEALAAGALVIAADAPQNREVLGGAGWLVDANADAFAAAIDRLPTVPDRAVAARAREVAQRCTIDAQLDRVLGVYQSLVIGPPLEQPA
jgi:glycosyltransferase involved in cell wall biosynthesis